MRLRRPVLRLHPRDLSREIVESVSQRPARTLFTMAGTIVGVASLLLVAGLTTTAGAQIDTRFTVLSATEVTVTDVTPDPELHPEMAFPANADRTVAALPGVANAAVYWDAPIRTPLVTTRFGRADGQPLSVIAADPGVFAAAHADLAQGRFYDPFHDQRAERVVVLGGDAATKLGITRIDDQPAIFVNDVAYTVIGILGQTQRLPQLMSAVILPAHTALTRYGPPTDQRAQMLVDTHVGSAAAVAQQLAVRLRPDAPQRLKVSAPADPTQLRASVSTDSRTLYIVLSAVSLLLGALGIGNSTLVAVLERAPEIGLRRALGAGRRHIGAQFLGESLVLGLVGSLVGLAIGVIGVVAISAGRHWTPVLGHALLLSAPGLGVAVGLLAGLYPSWRATRIEPIEALRR